MYNLFAPYGPVISVRIMTEAGTGRGRGFGFVSYQTREGAQSAIANLNGVTIANKRLKVQFKERKTPGYFQTTADTDDVSERFGELRVADVCSNGKATTTKAKAESETETEAETEAEEDDKMKSSSEDDYGDKEELLSIPGSANSSPEKRSADERGGETDVEQKCNSKGDSSDAKEVEGDHGSKYDDTPLLQKISTDSSHSHSTTDW